MENASSNWQVAFMGLIFLIIAIALARHARQRREAARASDAPGEPEWLEQAKEELAAARVALLKDEAWAEQACADREMRKARIRRLDSMVQRSQSQIITDKEEPPWAPPSWSGSSKA